jgi:NAD(P)-dependent dehydrogenase (short-subunit alcohol dehydrogenase family)
MIIADLSDDSQLDNLADNCPSLDGFVNNAGITETIMTPFIKRDKLMKVMETNTFAPILLTQRLLKKKKLTRGGSIVFTGSISGTCVCGGECTLFRFQGCNSWIREKCRSRLNGKGNTC